MGYTSIMDYRYTVFKDTLYRVMPNEPPEYLEDDEWKKLELSSEPVELREYWVGRLTVPNFNKNY